jgi:hypothetical protein
MIRIGIDRHIGPGLTIADKGFAVFALMKPTTSGVYHEDMLGDQDIQISPSSPCCNQQPNNSLLQHRQL